uniref:ABC transporter domain-containing protein n=1 Tax=Acrobeloides nanus TaxID=290746 RepID=A0A914C1T2_9BILA
MSVFEFHMEKFMGVLGCGKTTLLNILSHRIEGRIGGDILLNGQPLNKKRFNDLCEFVDMEVRLMPHLTIQELLIYHARLSLNCKQEAIGHRTAALMQQFDLVTLKHEKVGQLHESALRRLILVLHLVRDPVLIVIDEPVRDLDSLSAYQFMTSLQNHVRKHARMAIVSMRCPRSDIYQLLNQITLLFYGEVMYSGTTKQMPHYFSQLGYRCPIHENPAVYYLSLATVDRETPESYAESRTNAMKLVDHFRKNLENCEFPVSNTTNEAPILSCYFGAPTNTRRLGTLINRNGFLLFNSMAFFLSHLMLPFVILFVAIFGVNFTSTGLHIPQSAAGMIFLLIFMTGLIAVTSTCISFMELSPTMFWEVAQGLYNASYMLLAYLLISSIFDIVSILMSSAAFIWLTTFDLQLDIVLKLALVLFCTHMFYKLITLSIFVFIGDSYHVAIVGTLLCCISATVCSSFIKSYSSFLSINLYYPTYLSIERYANVILLAELMNFADGIMEANTFIQISYHHL